MSGQHHRPDVDTGDLAARYRAGTSIRQLAVEHDMSRPSVRDRLKNAGVELRSPEPYQRSTTNKEGEP